MRSMSERKKAILGAVNSGDKTSKQIARRLGLDNKRGRTDVCNDLGVLVRWGAVSRERHLIDGRWLWHYASKKPNGQAKPEVESELPVDLLHDVVCRARKSRQADAVVWQTASIALQVVGHNVSPDQCRAIHRDYMERQRRDAAERDSVAKLKAEVARLEQDNERLRLAFEAISEAVEAVKGL
jgi:hypothetical protein